MTIRVRVNGLPAPQGSKTHVGNGVMVESSRKTLTPWRNAIRSSVGEAMNAGVEMLDCPALLHANFYLPRPASHYNTYDLRPSAPEWPFVKPDLDKLVRAVMDGVTMGGGWRDDSRVVGVIAWKRYSDEENLPGCTIAVSEAEGFIR